jgi:uncharacterized protein
MLMPVTDDILADPNGKKFPKKIAMAIAILIPVLILLFVSFSKSHSQLKAASKLVEWGTYRLYDSATNKAPLELQNLDGQKIRSPGFMVPLEDSRSEVTEFLLVPSPQACIHAPPPPANQMIYVRMVGSPAKTAYGPVMVEGILRVTSQNHQYGTANFQIYGENVDPYQGE